MRNVYTLLIGFCLFSLTFTAKAEMNANSSDFQINALEDILRGELTESETIFVLETAAPAFNKTTDDMIEAYRAGGVLITIVEDDKATGKIVTVGNEDLETVVFVPRR